MMLMLVLGAALGAQDVAAAAPGAHGRFVICPGHRRCPPRPSRQGDDGTRNFSLNNPNAAPPSHQRYRSQIPRRTEVIGALRFGRGQTRLGPAARATLDRVAERLRASPTLEVMLEGHADPGGSDAANRDLAGWRAEAAADYLVLQGVAAERILTISWGETARVQAIAPRSVVVSLRMSGR